MSDYSDYIEHMSNVSSGLYLLTGFTFTVITFLLIGLKDVSSTATQTTLFYLTILFYLFMFMIGWNSTRVLQLCSKIPKESKGVNLFNISLYLVYILFPLSLTFLFHQWNLTYLVLGSLSIWATYSILVWFFIMKPLRKWRNELAS